MSWAAGRARRIRLARLGAQLRAAAERAGADYEARLGATATAYVRFATSDAALLELMFAGKQREQAGSLHEAADRGKRLIWLVDPDIGTIEPVEQTAKRDGWNTGRALSFRRVIKNDPPLEMDEDDRRVIDSLHHGFERSMYRYSVTEVYGPDPNKTLLALVGHPRVFDANFRDRQLELVRYPVELVISEARGGYRTRCRISPMRRPSSWSRKRATATG